MPTQIVSREDFENIMIAKPDVRYATTFLSNRLRKFSVPGESIMDKATGEIFTRRLEDGRVVSFFQNKKYMYDSMLELKILLADNEEFQFPDESHDKAYFVEADYDLMRINDDEECDITTGDMIFNLDGTNYHRAKFKVSPFATGFMFNLMTRDSDKAAVNWLTHTYDVFAKNYTGSDAAWANERRKFIDNSQWENSNVEVVYNVKLTEKSTGRVVTNRDFSAFMHMNDSHSIQFEEVFINQYFGNPDFDITVEIKKLVYDKLHFMLSHMSDEQVEEYHKVEYPDTKILTNYLMVMTFIESDDDLVLNDNEYLVALIDVPYVIRYMEKISKIITVEGNQNILSVRRPSILNWQEGNLWLEEVSDVYAGGLVIKRDSDTNVKEFEKYISTLTDPEISLDPYDTIVEEV